MIALKVPDMIDDADADNAPRRLARVGLAIAAFAFVVLPVAAAFIPLDAVAIGEGNVAVAGDRRPIQHRDGGIVRSVAVREGQHVRAGQMLLSIAGDEVRAQERALTAGVLGLVGQRARLEAELAGRPITWPAAFIGAAAEDRATIDLVQATQVRQFALRRQSRLAARAVLTQQESGASGQSAGFAAEAASASAQRRSLHEQIVALRPIAAKGFVSQNTLRTYERALMQLDGARADYAARAAAGRAQAGEYRQSYMQTQRKLDEDDGTMLRDTQTQLADLIPKLAAARRQLAGLSVRAPVAGRVVALQPIGIGTVVAPGAVLMDVVPDAAPLIVRANFAPDQIDGVTEGATVELRLPTFRNRAMPVIAGTVLTVSADALHDAAKGRSYFLVDIAVPEGSLVPLRRLHAAAAWRAGIPAEVVVPLARRTLLEYLSTPLAQAFTHARASR